MAYPVPAAKSARTMTPVRDFRKPSDVCAFAGVAAGVEADEGTVAGGVAANAGVKTSVVVGVGAVGAVVDNEGRGEGVVGESAANAGATVPASTAVTTAVPARRRTRTAQERFVIHILSVKRSGNKNCALVTIRLSRAERQRKKTRNIRPWSFLVPAWSGGWWS